MAVIRQQRLSIEAIRELSVKLHWSVILLSAAFWQSIGAPIQVHNQLNAFSKNQPEELIVSGPDSVKLRFTEPVDGFYRRAQILRDGRKPVAIKSASGEVKVVRLIDGDTADGDNFLFKFRIARELNWSLRLWSLDGSYIVLNTYDVIDGKLEPVLNFVPK